MKKRRPTLATAAALIALAGSTPAPQAPVPVGSNVTTQEQVRQAAPERTTPPAAPAQSVVPLFIGGGFDIGRAPRRQEPIWVGAPRPRRSWS